METRQINVVRKKPKPTKIIPSNAPQLFIELFGKIVSDQLSAGGAEMEAVSRKLKAILVEGVHRLITELRPPVVVEIGAGEGEFSTRIKNALPHTRVIAAEANPVVWSQHQSTLHAAGVEYINTCIAENSGRTELKVPVHPQAGVVTSAGGILPDTAYQDFKSFEVDAVTLDGVLGGDVDQPKAVWIDVEGAVGSVLKGGGRALASCVLLYTEVETAERWAGQMTLSKLLPLLQRRGLVPVLRDTQSARRFSVLFIREDLLAARATRRVCETVVRRFGRKLAGAARKSAKEKRKLGDVDRWERRKKIGQKRSRQPLLDPRRPG